jgi:hypothetical protein
LGSTYGSVIIIQTPSFMVHIQLINSLIMEKESQGSLAHLFLIQIFYPWAIKVASPLSITLDYCKKFILRAFWIKSVRTVNIKKPFRLSCYHIYTEFNHFLVKSLLKSVWDLYLLKLMSITLYF